MASAGGGRANPCPLCLALPRATCTSEIGTPRGDHAARINGIGPGNPRADTHVNHPLCRCYRCANTRYKQRVREQKAIGALPCGASLDEDLVVPEEVEPPSTPHRSTRAPAWRWLAVKGGPVPADMGPDRTLVPCYQCGAGMRERCRTVSGALRGPHTSRGQWGAWRYRRGTTDTEIAQWRLHEEAPAGEQLLAPQPNLLLVHQSRPVPSGPIPSQRSALRACGTSTPKEVRT